MDALEALENINQLNIVEVASQTIADNVEVIADLNATQLSQGIRSDGIKMSRRGVDYYPYAELTVALKQDKSGLSGITDRVTLYDTGAFYRALYAEVQGEDVTIGGRDEKSDELEGLYSSPKNSIFGLTDGRRGDAEGYNSKDELITSVLQSSWEKKITEVTGLEFGK